MSSSIEHRPRIYEPLFANYIRILSLLPSKQRSSKIQCTLTHVPVVSDKKITYSALSYTWGSAGSPGEIMLGGQPFLVQANLLLVLQTLRYEHVSRNLWIDALCINQLDVQERSSQVSLMSVIYRQAEVVLSWLGEDHDHIGQLFTYLKLRSGFLTSELELGIEKFSPIASEKSSGMTAKRFRSAFHALSNKPYWTRVWIIQEILSASVVYLLCGDSFMPLDYFVNAISSLDSVYGRYHNFMESTQQPSYWILRQYYDRQKGWSLDDLITLCWSCQSQCQDPRDRIYGILSLANEQHGIVPDYSRSVLELYIQIVKLLRAGWRESATQEQMESLLQPYSSYNLEQHLRVPDLETISDRLNPYRWGLPMSSTWHAIHPCSIITDIPAKATVSEGAWSELVRTRLTTAAAWKEAVKRWRGMEFNLHGPDSCNCAASNVNHNANLTLLRRGFAIPSDSQSSHNLSHPGSSIALSDWDKNLQLRDPFLSLDVVSTFSSKIRIFLTLHGAVGIGQWFAKVGDILCHVAGTEGEYLIVRPPKGSSSKEPFLLVGLAMLLDRKAEIEIDRTALLS